MSDASRQHLEELLERCILAHEQQDWSAVERIFAEHPDDAPELKRRLDRLEQLGVLAVPAATTDVPDELGEFRLLREIGRGGMGVVYLARQGSLDREVALKLVHPEMLFFGNARARFRREVLVIARLQHPNIVPILTCGEAEGIPYYAMEFVPGASLAEVLSELVGTSPNALGGDLLQRALARCTQRKLEHAPLDDGCAFQGSWVQLCCRFVREAALAVQYAHEQGVLHRDLKPSNLLLTTDGRVCVIDFGLASATGGDHRLTRSGATLGSLPYMAPEQVRGQADAVDERTDVYQLGATLYELLTMRPPFGDGSDDTRERILRGLPSPPSRSNPTVHPDVDAICLKALDVDPQRRYASARALADDLGAFLEQRNVAARRAPLPVRAGRWVRARPVHAAVAFAAFLLFVVLPTGYAVQQSLANARIRGAYDVAEQRREVAERNFEEALRAVDLMLMRTASVRLDDVPRTAGLRRELVQDAIAVHRRLLSTTASGGERLDRARARSQLRLGALHFELGEYPDAERELLAAGATLRELLAAATARGGDGMALRADLAHGELQLGHVLGRLGRFDDMVAAYERMDGHYRAVMVDPQRAAEHRADHLEARLALARGLAQTGRAQRAEVVWDELDAALGEDDGSLPELVRRLLWSRVAAGRGTLAAVGGDSTAAVAHFEEAMRRAGDVDAAAVADEDVEPAVRRDMGRHVAETAERLGTMLLQRRDWHAAAPWLDRSCDEFERLAALDPEIPDWRISLARSLGSRACNETQRGAVSDALADHERAVALLQEVVRVTPEDFSARRALAQAHADRASTLQMTGAADAAAASHRAADAEFVRLLDAKPDDDFLRGNYAALLANRALAAAEAGDHRDALRCMRRALELQHAVPGFVARRQAVEMELRASEFAFVLDDPAAGVEHMERARRSAAAMFAARPDDRIALDTSTWAEIEYGMMQWAEDQRGAAVATWRAVLPRAQRAAVDSPFARHLLGVLQLGLASAAVADQDLTEARKWFAGALACGASPRSPDTNSDMRALFDRDDLR